MKRDALAKMENQKVIPEKKEKEWTEDAELMDWLKGFIK